MRKLKKVLALAIAAFVSTTFAALPSSSQEEQISEDKVAIVNGVVISQSDFDREFKGIRQNLISRGKSISDDQLKAIKRGVLENLINLELIYQESQKNGIKVEESTIKEKLDSIKKQFPNDNDYNDMLKKMRLTETDLTSQIRRSITIEQFIAKKFNDKITVYDKETKSFYDSNPDAFKESGKIKASHILIKVDPQADEVQKAAARKKIEDIQNKVKKGDDFASLAKEFSKCPSSSGGGDLGFFERGQMVKPFEDAAFSLAPGEVSDIVLTRFGYHIIKCTDKKSGTVISYKDVKKKLQQHLKQKKLQQQLNVYTNGLEKKAKVERFVEGG